MFLMWHAQGCDLSWHGESRSDVEWIAEQSAMRLDYEKYLDSGAIELRARLVEFFQGMPFGVLCMIGKYNVVRLSEPETQNIFEVTQ